MKCPDCQGDGFTAEHDPACDGSCNYCPIQVQCETCEGTGEAIMNIQEAIEHTNNKNGMKMSMNGAISRINRSRGVVESDKFIMNELSGHYNIARKAWLEGDLETVADFFGLYV